MSDGPIVRAMVAEDFDAVRRIYAEGIASGDATFETVAPDADAWGEKFPACRLVAEWKGAVVAWAAVAPVSSRPSYRGVAEETIYVGAAARGRGVGRVLLDALVATSEAAGFWTLQAGIFPENEASLRLHAACGFRTIGVRERLGRTADGRWRDVILLERRSERTGG